MSHDDRCLKLRLAWLTYAQQPNVANACRHFGISRVTYDDWWKRYHTHGLKG